MSGVVARIGVLLAVAALGVTAAVVLDSSSGGVSIGFTNRTDYALCAFTTLIDPSPDDNKRPEPQPGCSVAASGTTIELRYGCDDSQTRWVVIATESGSVAYERNMRCDWWEYWGAQITIDYWPGGQFVIHDGRKKWFYGG